MLIFPMWKRVLVLGVCVLSVLYAVPSFVKTSFFQSLPVRQINLGLDLRGGVYLLYQVDTDSFVNEQLQSLLSDARRTLRRQRIGYTSLRANKTGLSVTLRKEGDLPKARRQLRHINPLLSLDTTGKTLSLTFSRTERMDMVHKAVTQSIEVIRRRIDETGTKEPIIQSQGGNRIVVQVPGAENPEEVKRLIGRTAKLTFHLVRSVATGGTPPPGTMALPSLDLGGQLFVNRRVEVSGEHLVDAQASFQNGQPVVSFRFDSIGARRFADLTRKHVGRLLAIVLDNKVVSSPSINGPIMGGSGVIQGSFTLKETNDLALLLRAGALPAPLHILEERTVGPGLGRDSVRAGQIASLVGFLLVVAFMFFYYRLFGLFANVALLFNLSLILSLLALLQATLTLPGIAGIVLTLGMAVDANVLIFERIREEARSGRGPAGAIDAGFKRAVATVFDSNATTLVAALILYLFGSGPIKGFATTLSIGILTSMFTAIMLTRLFIVLWFRAKRPETLPL